MGKKKKVKRRASFLLSGVHISVVTLSDLNTIVGLYVKSPAAVGVRSSYQK
jgi:hypothetical protein